MPRKRPGGRSSSGRKTRQDSPSFSRAGGPRNHEPGGPLSCHPREFPDKKRSGEYMPDNVTVIFQPMNRSVTRATRIDCSRCCPRGRDPVREHLRRQRGVREVQGHPRPGVLRTTSPRKMPAISRPDEMPGTTALPAGPVSSATVNLSFRSRAGSICRRSS